GRCWHRQRSDCPHSGKGIFRGGHFRSRYFREALALALENAERLGLNDHIRFEKSNLLRDIKGTFDLIVANLPYIAAQDRHILPREVLHDPDVALFSGARGDELVRELISQAPARLRPGGMLALEVGLGQ